MRREAAPGPLTQNLTGALNPDLAPFDSDGPGALPLSEEEPLALRGHIIFCATAN
jgi:hypothetical protein